MCYMSTIKDISGNSKITSADEGRKHAMPQTKEETKEMN